jgi:hypothetical protein
MSEPTKNLNQTQSQTETEDVNPFKASSSVEDLKKFYEEWEVAKMMPDKQIEWFRDVFRAALAKALPVMLMGNDAIEEIYVIEPLFSSALRALKDLDLDAETAAEVLKQMSRIHTGQEPQEAPPAEAVANVQETFQRIAGNLRVLPISFEKLYNPALPMQHPVQTFIHVVTREQKARDWINSWDQQMGLTAGLLQSGCPVIPKYEEKRMLFFFLFAIQKLQEQEERVQKATLYQPNK